VPTVRRRPRQAAVPQPAKKISCAWLGTKADPIAAALVLVIGLKSDIAAFKIGLAETRAAIAALRDAWSRAEPLARSRRRKSPVRTIGAYRRITGDNKEVELT
jgi:hypothetical protein